MTGGMLPRLYTWADRRADNTIEKTAGEEQVRRRGPESPGEEQVHEVLPARLCAFTLLCVLIICAFATIMCPHVGRLLLLCVLIICLLTTIICVLVQGEAVRLLASVLLRSPCLNLKKKRIQSKKPQSPACIVQIYVCMIKIKSLVRLSEGFLKALLGSLEAL